MSVLLLLMTISVYLATDSPAYYESSWIRQIWGGADIGGISGLGHTAVGTADSNGNWTITSNYWVVSVVLVGAILVSIAGIGFYLVFPEARSDSKTQRTRKESNSSQRNPEKLDI